MGRFRGSSGCVWSRFGVDFVREKGLQMHIFALHNPSTDGLRTLEGAFVIN
jgi:hypothetical protein